MCSVVFKKGVVLKKVFIEYFCQMLNYVYRQSINGFRFFRNDLAHRNTELSLFAAVFRLGSLQRLF
jgi:hypothetical protein